jgi:hypothetical protein
MYLIGCSDETIVDLIHRDVPVGQWAEHKHRWNTGVAMLTATAHT